MVSRAAVLGPAAPSPAPVALCAVSPLLWEGVPDLSALVSNSQPCPARSLKSPPTTASPDPPEPPSKLGLLLSPPPLFPTGEHQCLLRAQCLLEKIPQEKLRWDQRQNFLTLRDGAGQGRELWE